MIFHCSHCGKPCNTAFVVENADEMERAHDLRNRFPDGHPIKQALPCPSFVLSCYECHRKRA